MEKLPSITKPKPSVKLKQSNLRAVSPLQTLWPVIDEYFQVGEEARQMAEHNWFLCICFYSGLQYSYYNTTSHTLHHLRPVLVGHDSLITNYYLGYGVKSPTRSEMTRQ